MKDEELEQIFTQDVAKWVGGDPARRATLAVHLRVARSTVERYEKGSVHPHTNIMNKILTWIRSNP